MATILTSLNSNAFHRASEHVVVAGIDQEKDLLHIEIYTKDGEFTCSNQIYEKGIHIFKLGGMTVTTEGRIAVAFPYLEYDKILVI